MGRSERGKWRTGVANEALCPAVGNALAGGNGSREDGQCAGDLGRERAHLGHRRLALVLHPLAESVGLAAGLVQVPRRKLTNKLCQRRLELVVGRVAHDLAPVRLGRVPLVQARHGLPLTTGSGWTTG